MTEPIDIQSLEQRYERKTLWARFFILFIGLWMIAAPLTFDYSSQYMTWSDIITGLIITILAIVDLRMPGRIVKGFHFLLGIWLQIAPIVFSAPAAVSYLNDTVMGMLLIGLSNVLPTMQDMIYKPSQEIPPGWTYDPSTWIQRAPITVLALFCWFITRYFAAYHLGYTTTLWDPLFPNGTLAVTGSHAFTLLLPVSKYAAAIYSIVILLALKGGTSRWRTMPWVVCIFGFIVVPVGLLNIVFILLQPVVLGQWCTLCLIEGLCLLGMMVLTLDECIAVINYLFICRRKRLSLWKVFWMGGYSAESSNDTRSPQLNSPLHEVYFAMTLGLSVPRTLLATTLLGAWLLLSPVLFKAGASLDDIDHLCGGLVVVFSVIAWAEVARPVRYLNILIGLLLVLNILWIRGHTSIEVMNNFVVAALLIILSIRRGRIYEKYGSWQRWVW